MSKILSKILKILILPSALIIISKAVGIYLSTMFFNLQFFLDTRAEGLFSIQILFLDNESTILANSFSNIFMLTIFTFFTAYLIFKYWLSINSKYNPRTLVKLTNLNLLFWVNKKDNTAIKVFVWIMFVWVIAVLIISDVLKGYTYEWIGILAFLIVILSTWSLIRTFEIELENIYPEESKLY